MVCPITLQNLKQGNENAFELIFQEYATPLYFIALSYCSNKQIAEDAIQESFIYIWNNREKINPAIDIKFLLIKITKNYIFNYYRHKKVQIKHEEQIIHELNYNSSNEEIIDETVLNHIKETINRFPDSCRKIFIMTIIEGLSYAETAKKLNISINTVKTQIKIGYKKLKSTSLPID